MLLDNVPLLIPLSKYRILQCYEHVGNSDSAKSSYEELAETWSGADGPTAQISLSEQKTRPNAHLVHNRPRRFTARNG